MSDVVLPALGESVTEGTVTRWLKNVGDRIDVDEPLLEVSTDKVDTEVPSPVAGVIQEILVAEDETAEVGAVLARIGDSPEGAAAAGSDAAAAPEPSPEQEQEQTEQKPPVEAPSEPKDASTDTEPPAEGKAGSSGSAAVQDVVLPSLGESITEGTVTRWLKQTGDDVEVDEPLLEVSTDKVDTEVPSPVAGVLREVVVAEDETVEVGGVLARIGPAGSDDSSSTTSEKPQPESPEPEPEPEPEPTRASAPAAPPQAPAPSNEPAANQPAASESRESATQPPTPSGGGSAGYVTPIVRKLASERGVDLATVTGTGVGGRIRKEDVLAAAETAASASSATREPEAAAVSPLRGTTQKMSRLRKVIASRAVESLQQTAQLTTVVEVDVTRVAQFRERVKQEFLDRTGTKLSFLPFFALAAAEALRAYPIVNATVDGESIVYPETENLSIAVDTERGLLTPVVRDAGEKSLADLAKDIADLAARTRDNALTPDELSGGTFTLTNTGSRGALFDTPLVFLPQSAILGTGAVVKRAVVVPTEDGDSIAVRSLVYLALSYDHRIIDGADAARFLTQVKQRLEAGAFDANLGI